MVSEFRLPYSVVVEWRQGVVVVSATRIMAFLSGGSGVDLTFASRTQFNRKEAT
jgi:hypothetical protein